jgi:hypothetical protein
MRKQIQVGSTVVVRLYDGREVEAKVTRIVDSVAGRKVHIVCSLNAAGRRYTHIFDFPGDVVNPPNDMHVTALVDGHLQFIVKSEVGDRYGGGERGAAVRRALILDDTLVACAHDGNVIARIDDY